MEDRIGPYLIRGTLGEGSSAVVYLAHRDGDGQVVALKVLRPQLTADAQFRRRFLREARTAAEVTHPNLLPVLDQGEIDGRVFLVIAHAPGGSLATVILENAPLSLDRTLSIADDVAAGLDALHAAGIVHRDVKPSNVMMLADGSAALADFGLAKGRAYTALTSIGRPLGTLAYLAPERVRGGEATVASDLYSFGCLVYECFSGALPFRDTNLYQLAFAHLGREPQSLMSIRPDISRYVDEVVLGALAKQPADRPISARALVESLNAAARLAGSGV